MSTLEKQLFVKRSTLPGAGKGLFTRKPIAKGTKIVEYVGEITTWKEVDDRKGRNGYIYYVNRKHVIDAWNDKASLARYANDAKGLKRTPGITNNCEYEHEGVRVFLYATKNIPAGAEILVAYGKEYWDIMKENWRLIALEEAAEAAAKLARKEAKAAKSRAVKVKKTGKARKAGKAKAGVVKKSIGSAGAAAKRA